MSRARAGLGLALAVLVVAVIDRPRGISLLPSRLFNCPQCFHFAEDFRPVAAVRGQLRKDVESLAVGVQHCVKRRENPQVGCCFWRHDESLLSLQAGKLITSRVVLAGYQDVN